MGGMGEKLPDRVLGNFLMYDPFGCLTSHFEQHSNQSFIPIDQCSTRCRSHMVAGYRKFKQGLGLCSLCFAIGDFGNESGLVLPFSPCLG